MSDILPPTSGTDQRLDRLYDEVKGLRDDLASAPVAWRQALDRIGDEVAQLRAQLAPETDVEPADGETVELREPETPPDTPKGQAPARHTRKRR